MVGCAGFRNFAALGCLLVVLLLACVLPSRASDVTLPDARALIGHVFKYKLAASSEDGSHVQVTEANQDSLPSWLYYSPKSGSLKGVPGPADRGVYIIAVRGLSGSRSASGDVFALSVGDDVGSVAEVAVPLRADDKTTTCRQRDPVTVAGVVVDADLATLSARQRVRLLVDLAATVGVHERHVAIFPSSSVAGRNSWLPDATDKSVLVAGRGNVAVAASKVQAAAVWVVGCGTVSDDHVDLLEDVEKSAADGRLARAVGHGIVGWRVANKLPADSAARHRARRQAGQTDSPDRVMSTGVPTSQPPPSASFVGDLSRSAVVMSSAAVTSVPSASLPVIRPTAAVSSPPPSVATTAQTTVTTTSQAPTTTTAATTTTTTAATTTAAVIPSTKVTTATPITSTARAQQPTTAAATAPATSTSARPVTTATSAAATTVLVVVSPAIPMASNASTKPPRVTSTSPSGTSSAVVLPVTVPVVKSMSTTAAATSTRVTMPVTSRAAPPTTTSAPTSTAQMLSPTTPSGRITVRPAVPTLRALQPRITITAQPERLLKFKLPGDTFSEPLEDLHVALLLPNGKPLPHSHWVSFRPADYEIVVLASRSSHHGEFVLGAVNAANRTAQTSVTVHVEAPPAGGPDPAAGATQVYRLTIEADYDQLVSNVTAFESLVSALENLHKGRRVVITALSRGSVVVSYALLPEVDERPAAATNESAQCDQRAAQMDNSQLFNSDGSMRNDVQRGMPFKILSLSSTPRAACQGIIAPISVQPTLAATTPTATSRRPPHKAPVAKFDSLVLVAERGKELRYELPDDLFMDEEDGNTKNLKLLLRSIDSDSLHPTATDTSASAPLQLHMSSRGGSSRRAVLQGLFWEQPSRSTAQRYQLVASNRHGLLAVIRLQLNITDPPVQPVFGLRLKLGVDYNAFANDVNRQLELLQRVALRLYGDASTAHFSLLDVRAEGTKTLVLWTNTSVSAAAASTGSCPLPAIAAVARVVMYNKTIVAAVMDKKTGIGALEPVSIDLEPRGLCVSKLKHEKALAPVPYSTGEATEADGFWLTVVVPVIVVIVLLVVAIIVAAVLISRRRRSTRANVSGGAGGANGTYIGKTVPVIFDEEREDGGGTACRTPLMHEDKPAGPPPPDYPNLYGGSGGVHAEQKQPLMSGARGAQEADGSPGGGNDAMPPYQPPTPPVSEPDETSTFPRAGAAGASIGARSQQQNFVPP